MAHVLHRELDRWPNSTVDVHRRPNPRSSLVGGSEVGRVWPSSPIGATPSPPQAVSTVIDEDELMSDFMRDKTAVQSSSFTSHRAPLGTTSRYQTSRESVARDDYGLPSKRLRAQDASEHEQSVEKMSHSSGLSQAGRADASSTIGSLSKLKTKRSKTIFHGFRCRHGCGEVFNRTCDENKHYQRTYVPKYSHPYSCPRCQAAGKVRRFLYPKDVRRHLKQVHHVSEQGIPFIITSSTSPNAGEIRDSTPTTPSSRVLPIWTFLVAVYKLKMTRNQVHGRSTGGSAGSTHDTGSANQDTSCLNAREAEQDAVGQIFSYFWISECPSGQSTCNATLQWF